MDESREIARLRRSLTLENLWMYILRVLLEGETYAYALRDEIEKKFGFRPGKITVYKVLYLLRRHGLVQVRREMVGGRLRKYYTVTPRARDEMRRASSILRKTAEGAGS